jgi:hypothetical protein
MVCHRRLNCELENQDADGRPEVKVPSQVVYSRDGQHASPRFAEHRPGIRLIRCEGSATLVDKPVGLGLITRASTICS